MAVGAMVLTGTASAQGGEITGVASTTEVGAVIDPITIVDTSTLGANSVTVASTVLTQVNLITVTFTASNISPDLNEDNLTPVSWTVTNDLSTDWLTTYTFALPPPGPPGNTTEVTFSSATAPAGFTVVLTPILLTFTADVGTGTVPGASQLLNYVLSVPDTGPHPSSFTLSHNVLASPPFTAIPEPASLTLACIGIVSLGGGYFVRRKRKPAASPNVKDLPSHLA